MTGACSALNISGHKCSKVQQFGLDTRPLRLCREVFSPYGVRVFLCFWHVKRSWLKNLHRKVPRHAQYDMFLSLEKIMLMLKATGQSTDSFSRDVRDAAERFCTQYAEHADFIAYFKKTWAHKLGRPSSDNVFLLSYYIV